MVLLNLIRLLGWAKVLHLDDSRWCHTSALRLVALGLLGLPLRLWETPLESWPLRQPASLVGWGAVFVCESCCDKGPQAAGLKHQTWILSQFWRPEVRGQGVGRAGSFWPRGHICPRPVSRRLWLAGSRWRSLAYRCRGTRPLLSHSQGVLPACGPLSTSFSF